MKNLFNAFMLFCVAVLYSQTDTINKKTFKFPLLLNTKQDSIKPPKYTIIVKGNNDIFSVYNQSSKLNDIFIINSDTTTLGKSINNFDNNNRNPKIDSFNPYGVSDAKSGLIIGAIAGIFRSILNSK